ncbi:hypothetical protein [Bradyrhizobium sp. JYMT SZCCT0428]|uniref:hypothetical protein n=1 Tax=Bradyrhizobium sp. JYMT SZCCT0428 TaxID=2807673 RepID=UPI002012E39C|nr:hypothetical protein [Bradyrhizobium sp. JYMT SZCCT0428]
MSDTDDEFRVRLGRIGNRRGRKAIGYVKRVRKIAQKAGIGTTHRASGFTGSRIGRGYAQGTVFASRRSAGQRRVVIKARIVRIKAGQCRRGAGSSALCPARRRHARGESRRALRRGQGSR